MQSTKQKFIIFKADYSLALPVHSVLKVIHTPLSEETINTGLIHTEKYTITIVNLDEKLAVAEIPQTNIYNFIIFAQSTTGELIAIPVREPPDLIELADENIRALPQSYFNKVLLKISTNVGVISEQTTIFILNVDQILSLVSESDRDR